MYNYLSILIRPILFISPLRLFIERPLSYYPSPSPLPLVFHHLMRYTETHHFTYHYHNHVFIIQITRVYFIMFGSHSIFFVECIVLL